MDDFKGISVIKMKKEWVPDDESFFADNRFSSAGLYKYWASIDASFRHWEMIVERNRKFKEWQQSRKPSKRASSPSEKTRNSSSF